MAKKRVNYKFLILLGVPLVLLISAGVAYKTIPQVKWIIRGTPQSHADQAKALYDQGKYNDAKEQYLRAVQLKNASDPVWLTAAADCYNHMTVEDPVNLQKAYGLLRNATTANPNYEPALRQQLKITIDIAEQTRGANASRQWGQVTEDAKALLNAVPNDPTALITIQRAIIQQRLLGGTGTSDELDKAITSLVDLSRKDPFNADALAYALQGMVGKIGEQIRQSDRDAAAKTAQDGLALLNEALKAHQDDALLHLRAATFLGPLMAYAGEKDAAKIGTRLLGEAETASKLVKPGDAHYVDAKLTYARVLQQSGKNADVAPVFDEVIKEHPGDLGVRLVYAEFLGQIGKPADALKLLDNVPPQKPDELLGVQGALAKQYQQAAIAQQLNLQLQIVPTLSGDERDKMFKQMDDEYARLTVDSDQTLQALYIRGQMELARNTPEMTVKAVQTLNKALSLAGGNSGDSTLDMRERVMFTLAQANLRTDQTGRAKDLLYQIVSGANNFLPARILLARTLLAEKTPQAISEAKTQLDFLAKAMPNNPEVARMRVMTYDKNVPAERTELEKTLADFPQDTPQNIIEKSRMAAFLDHPDQGIKLLEQLNSGPSASQESVLALAEAYNNNKQKDKALAAIDAALAKNADQPPLKMLRARVAGEDMAAVMRESADDLKDPFAKEFALYQAASITNNTAEMQAHLEAAEKLKPDDGRVKDLLFQMALRKGDLNRASQLCDWLSQHNQDQANGLIFRTRLATAKAAASTKADERTAQLTAALDSAQQLTKKMPEFAESWVVLGQVQMTLQNYTEAEQSFAAALTRQSQNPDAIIGQIDAVERQGKFDYEKTLLADAKTRLPTNARVNEQQLSYELNHGDPEKTIAPREAQLKAVLAAKIDPLPAYYNLAQAYLVTASRRSGDEAKGFYGKAAATASEGLKLNPGFAELAAMLADASLQLGKFDEGVAALTNFQKATDAAHQPTAAMMLAEFYGRSNKPAEQEKALRDLIAASPDFLPARSSLSNLLAGQNRLDDALAVLPKDATKPEILKQRVELLTNFGKYDQAKAEIDEQLKATSDPSSTLLDQQARVLAATGDDNAALGVLEKALTKDPNDIDAKYYRAKIRLNRGLDIQQAITDLRDVLRQVNNYDVRMTLAGALANSGDNAGAIQVVSETIPLRPSAPEPRLLLVNLYTGGPAPRWDKAQAVIDDALKEPSLAHNPQILNSAAQLWLTPEHKDADKALALVNDALKQLPNNPRLIQTQLQALVAARKPRDVLSITQPLIDAKPPALFAFGYRGQAHVALDDKQAAMDDYSAGIAAALAVKDGASVNQLIDNIARDIGIGPAKARIAPLAEKGDHRWQLIMSSLCQRDHDMAGAKQWAERILADESNLPPDILFAARTQAGQLYLLSDPPEPTKAIPIYNKILQTDPHDLNAMNNLANTMLMPNSGAAPADAVKVARQAADQIIAGGAALAQFKPFVFDTLGWAQVQAGDSAGAVDTLKQSIDAGALPDSYYHLGEAYLAFKPAQIENALNALRQAQEMVNKAGSSSDPTLPGKISSAITRAGSATTAPSVTQ